MSHLEPSREAGPNDREFRIYLSSTLDDLREEREAAVEILRRHGRVIDSYRAGPEPTVENCLSDVGRSQLYVVILGKRYGWVPAGESDPQAKSITELEYDACAADPAAPIPRLVFVRTTNPDRFSDDDNRPQTVERMRRFRGRASDEQQPYTFDTLPQFTVALTEAAMRARTAWESADGVVAATRRAGVRDPYCNYLARLYDRVNRYFAAKLTTSLRDHESHPEPIRLSTGVDVLFDPLFAVGGIADEPAREFNDFSDAFDYYDGRVCLLGAPGAGKTITLLHYARDAIAKRRQNISEPIPILGIVPDWNPDKLSVAAWLDGSRGAPANASEVIDSGKALLLLDGLDELGSQREDPKTGQKYDPRLRFIEQIPDNNRILVTCRTLDYAAIGEQLPLGAITLKPLTDLQMQCYLRSQNELLDFIRLDVTLKEWLSTPLLLSFFAFTYEGLSVSERVSLLAIKNHGDLRDKIYARYTEQRFEHERHKIRSVAFTLDDIYEFLGACAIFSGYQISRSADAPGAWGNAVRVATAFDNVRRKLGLEPEDYMQQLANLSLLIPEGDTMRFIHPTMRDYFAYSYAVNSFRIYERGVSDDSGSGSGTGGWGFRLVRCIEELAQLRDYRALPHIISQTGNTLETKRDMIVGDDADQAVETLLKSAAQSRLTGAIDIIAKYLFPVSEPRGYVRPEPLDAQVAAALELIGSPEALAHAHAWHEEASPELRARADRIKQEWAAPESD